MIVDIAYEGVGDRIKSIWPKAFTAGTCHVVAQEENGRLTSGHLQRDKDGVKFPLTPEQLYYIQTGEADNGAQSET